MYGCAILEAAYILIENKNELTKDVFYAQLERELDITPNNDIKIIKKDLDTKRGNEDGYTLIVEKSAIRQRCSYNSP